MALFTENYQEEMMHILKDMAHVRISGTKEEADCAIYLQECCKKMGFETRLEAFQVEMCDIHEAVLTVARDSAVLEAVLLKHHFITCQILMPAHLLSVRERLLCSMAVLVTGAIAI